MLLKHINIFHLLAADIMNITVLFFKEENVTFHF